MAAGNADSKVETKDHNDSIQNIDPEQFRLILVTKKIHCSLLQEAD